MCGIVGYVGPDPALPIIVEGLRRLEYRGYDSAGIAVADGGLTVLKRAGKLSALEELLAENGAPSGSAGMGHTRWATHGAPTDENAHPHVDCSGRVAVIHNGIIENFRAHRERLTKSGHAFASETDTEVVAHLVEERLDGGGDLAAAVREVVRELRGAYSLVVMSAEDPGRLVGVRVSSPLVVGVGAGEMLLASDIPAVLDRTSTVIPVAEGQIVDVTSEGAVFTDFSGTAAASTPIEVNWDVGRAQKGGYDDFML